MLSPAWYMLQVYDRVLTSYDENTLLGLSLLAVFFYIIYALLERYRGFMLVDISEKIDEEIISDLHDGILDNSQKGKGKQRNYLDDLNAIKQFLTGQSMVSFLDTPWVPIYLVTIAMLHPNMGWLALLSVLTLFGIAVLNEKLTRNKIHEAESSKLLERKLISNAMSASESIQAMGMRNVFHKKFIHIHSEYLSHLLDASINGVTVSSISKFFRLFIQSILLGYGAYLAINQQITAGMIIASSILLGRALAPIEGIINSWKQLAEFRKSYANLNIFLQARYNAQNSIEFGRPKGKIELHEISLRLRETGGLTLDEINLTINDGESLAIIGPSGAGKTSLVKILCGIYKPTKGKVLVDGVDLAFRNLGDLGKYVGYLSQTTELCSGKIAQNIARFGDLDSNAVLKAAKLSGLHDTLIQLPEGYETILGDSGYGLSEGQKKKIGLARAIYQDPAMVFLDEPGSGLDEASMASLVELIKSLKERGATLIFTTHQPSLAQLADKILVLVNGRMKLYGKRSDVVNSLKINN